MRKPFIFLVLMIAAMVSVISLGSQPAFAAVTAKVCFAVDASGSISDTDYDEIEIEFLAAAIKLIPNGADPVEITVIVFSNDDPYKAIRGPTEITTAAEAQLFADEVRELKAIDTGGATNIELVVNECTAVLLEGAVFGDRVLREISVITDGFPTAPGTNAQAQDAAIAAAVQVTKTRFNASEPYVDFVDVLLVSGANDDQAADFAELFVRPQPFEHVHPPVLPNTENGLIFHLHGSEAEAWAQFRLAMEIKLGATLGIELGDEPAVGGIAELPEIAAAPLETAGSSGAGAGVLASVAGAVLVGGVSLSGAAWYSRKRIVSR